MRTNGSLSAAAFRPTLAHRTTPLTPTDPLYLAARLLIDGYVIVPDVAIGRELEELRAAFEREAARRGRRDLKNDELATVPEFVRYVGHPRLMPVLDAYMGHFGHEPALACLSLGRDIFDPAAPPPPPFTIPTDHRKIRMHNDGSGDGNGPGLSFDVLSQGCACLLYLDDTFPEAGSIIQAVGSHHLSRRGEGGRVVSPPLELVQDTCEIKYVGVKAGSVAIQRAFNWHEAGPPPRQPRRQLRADYTPKALYHKIALDGRPVHMRMSREAMAMLPAERRRYVVTE